MKRRESSDQVRTQGKTSLLCESVQALRGQQKQMLTRGQNGESDLCRAIGANIIRVWGRHHDVAGVARNRAQACQELVRTIDMLDHLGREHQAWIPYRHGLRRSSLLTNLDSEDLRRHSGRRRWVECLALPAGESHEIRGEPDPASDIDDGIVGQQWADEEGPR